ALAQMRQCVANVLQRCAGPWLAGLRIDAVVLLRDDAALLQLVKQEATIGRDVALALVFAQQIATSALQPARLAIGRGQQVVMLGREVGHGVDGSGVLLGLTWRGERPDAMR